MNTRRSRTAPPPLSRKDIASRRNEPREAASEEARPRRKTSGSSLATAGLWRRVAGVGAEDSSYERRAPDLIARMEPRRRIPVK
jgi:hypothetical protein